MTLIDQRILIDAPPQVVWEYISDPDRLSRWHAGYASVSVLTTQQTGLGTRRRCTPAAGGRDVIEEITAWVDGLGYEYRVIEGGPYRTMQGRIRLQTLPDGTSVQWTLAYQPRGLIGLLKNRMSGQRQMAAMMAESLRQLRRQIDALGQRMDDSYRARVAIQGRLNATERAQYQRRHPAPAGIDPLAPGGAPQEASAPAAEVAGDRPTPEESAIFDTQPRPIAGVREALAAPPVDEQDTQPTRTVEPQPAASEAAPVPSARPAPEVAPPPPPVIPPPPPPRPPAGPVAAQPPLAAPPESAPLPPDLQRPPTEPVERRRTPPRGIPAVRVDAGPPAPEPGGDRVPPPRPKTDTSDLSIWEVFGVRRPSEQDAEVLEDLIRSVQTREMEAVPPARARHSAPVRRAQVAAGLRLRLALRAARVRLRGPQATQRSGS